MLVEPTGTMIRTPRHGKIYVVGEAPGRTENMTGLPFVGGSGQMLLSDLGRHGVLRTNIRIANVYWLQPPGNDFAKRNKIHAAQYVEALHADIKQHQPDLILAVGVNAMRELVDPNAKLDDYVGYIAPYRNDINIPVMTIHHPAKVMRFYQWNYPNQIYIAKAVKWSKSPQEALRQPQEDFDLNCTAARMIDEIKQHKGEAFLDIETNPKKKVITHIGVAFSESHALCYQVLKHSDLETVQLLEAIRDAKDVKWLAFNADYEITWFKKIFGVSLKVYADPMIMHHDLFPEGEKSLQYLATIYLDVPAWKHTAIANEPLYNCRDCCRSLSLYKVILSRMSEGDLKRYFHGTHRQLEAASCSAMVGLHVDVEQKKGYITELEQEIEAVNAAVSQYNINANSPKQLGELLYDTFGLPVQYEKGKRTTNKNAIKKLLTLAKRIKHNDALVFLASYQKWKTLKSIFSKELNSIIPDKRGLVYTSFNVAGTETQGRWSSSGPSWTSSGTNMQNRKKIYRGMFKPHKYYLMITGGDGSQAEARVVAALCNDQVLLDAFSKGVDIHKLTAAMMYGIPIDKVKPEQREQGKRSRHACNYNMTFITMATLYDISNAEAKELIDRYHKANPLLREVYFPAIRAMLQSTGSITTPFGFTRKFTGRLKDVETFNGACAHIPQHTVGRIYTNAFARLYEEYYSDPDVIPILQIHDEVLVVHPINRQLEIQGALKRAMEIPIVIKSFVGPTHELVIPADLKAGYNFGPRKVIKLDDSSEKIINPLGLRSITYGDELHEPRI